MDQLTCCSLEFKHDFEKFDKTFTKNPYRYFLVTVYLNSDHIFFLVETLRNLFRTPSTINNIKSRDADPSNCKNIYISAFDLFW